MVTVCVREIAVGQLIGYVVSLLIDHQPDQLLGAHLFNARFELCDFATF